LPPFAEKTVQVKKDSDLMPRMAEVIRVHQLTKSYGDVRAVQGIDFNVRSGEIFAMLGPNGAGKSTTVEILEGLRSRDGGEVNVLGIDPAHDPHQLKSRIGVVLQHTVFPNKITVSEVIDLYGKLYGVRPRTKELLERFALTEKTASHYADLSGGQKQKLALILAMINDPPVVFLDEPTTGVDAHSRRAIHDWLRQLRSEGRTVFLTTHYIHEAEQLADRIAIVGRGQIIRMGTPTEISSDISVLSQIRVRTSKPLTVDAAANLPGVASANEKNENIFLNVLNPALTLTALIRHLDSQNNELLEVSIQRPTLEDVFLKLTGEQKAEEEK
jgi:ABC-2 type transport system ATP-binding protein